jgi:hypothetical protein
MHVSFPVLPNKTYSLAARKITQRTIGEFLRGDYFATIYKATMFQWKIRFLSNLIHCMAQVLIY